MLVIGAGATGMQVASIFGALGTQTVLCQAGPRIAPTEDEEVSAELARAYREDGIEVFEECGHVRGFEATANGVRITFPNRAFETQLVVRATGWIADTCALNLTAAGVATNQRGFIAVDQYLRTSAPHIFAAGDVLGRDMLVPQAVRDGYLAGGNAAIGESSAVPNDVEPIGSFTDPEYAKVGLTESQTRERHDVLVSKADYAETTRPIIDGRTRGFCKLVIDRATPRAPRLPYRRRARRRSSANGRDCYDCSDENRRCRARPALFSNVRKRFRSRGAARATRTRTTALWRTLRRTRPGL